MYTQLLTMLLALTIFPAHAAEADSMFEQRRTHLSLAVGNGYAFNDHYLVAGASATHYLFDGLGIGLSFENWSGGSPGIKKYSPFAQYVFYQESEIKPYVGGFYRHTAANGMSGVKSIGGRVGAYMAAERNAYFSVGMVHESYLDCRQTLLNACRLNFAEISFTFGL